MSTSPAIQITPEEGVYASTGGIPIPDFRQHQLIFLLSSKQGDLAAQAAELMTVIKERKQTPLYSRLCSEKLLTYDGLLEAELHQANDKELVELDAKIKDAEDNLGESEIREAMLAKANFYGRICNKTKAVEAYRAAEEKTVAVGQKLDIEFTLVRLGFFHSDPALVVDAIEKAEALLEKGADWDRKNRLKVYKAVQAFQKRDLKGASKLLMETFGTYAVEELMPHVDFVRCTVVASLPHLPRPEMKAKLLDSPELVSVESKLGPVANLARSLYDCEYVRVLPALAEACEEMRTNWLLSHHADHFCREMRVRAYSQMLESYRSVQLESMAREFGVSASFMDAELSKFIALGRLHCKIDRVGGIVDTNRPDSRNALYQSTIRAGDSLLNRLQKLARLVVV